MGFKESCLSRSGFERGTGGACCDDNNNNNNNEDDDVGRSDDRVTESSRQEGTYLREGAL
jgi:hypothetical protein